MICWLSQQRETMQHRSRWTAFKIKTSSPGSTFYILRAHMCVWLCACVHALCGIVKITRWKLKYFQEWYEKTRVLYYLYQFELWRRGSHSQLDLKSDLERMREFWEILILELVVVRKSDKRKCIVKDNIKKRSHGGNSPPPPKKSWSSPIKILIIFKAATTTHTLMHVPIWSKISMSMAIQPIKCHKSVSIISVACLLSGIFQCIVQALINYTQASWITRGCHWNSVATISVTKLIFRAQKRSAVLFSFVSNAVKTNVDDEGDKSAKQRHNRCAKDVKKTQLQQKNEGIIRTITRVVYRKRILKADQNWAMTSTGRLRQQREAVFTRRHKAKLDELISSNVPTSKP